MRRTPGTRRRGGTRGRGAPRCRRRSRSRRGRGRPRSRSLGPRSRLARPGRRLPRRARPPSPRRTRTCATGTCWAQGEADRERTAGQLGWDRPPRRPVEGRGREKRPSVGHDWIDRVGFRCGLGSGTRATVQIGCGLAGRCAARPQQVRIGLERNTGAVGL